MDLHVSFKFFEVVAIANVLGQYLKKLIEICRLEHFEDLAFIKEIVNGFWQFLREEEVFFI